MNMKRAAIRPLAVVAPGTKEDLRHARRPSSTGHGGTTDWGSLHFPSRTQVGARTTTYYCTLRPKARSNRLVKSWTEKVAQDEQKLRHTPARIIDRMEARWNLIPPEVTSCCMHNARRAHGLEGSERAREPSVPRPLQNAAQRRRDVAQRGTAPREVDDGGQGPALAPPFKCCCDAPPQRRGPVLDSREL